VVIELFTLGDIVLEITASHPARAPWAGCLVSAGPKQGEVDMGEARCPACGAEKLAEEFTVDRLGVCHWFQRCAHCDHRQAISNLDPAYDNPYDRIKTPSWRPDVPPLARLA